MQLTREKINLYTKLIGLCLLLGLTGALISAVAGDKLPYMTSREDYKSVYAYTTEPPEQVETEAE